MLIMGWDLRSLFSALHPFARLYMFLMVVTFMASAFALVYVQYQLFRSRNRPALERAADLASLAWLPRNMRSLLYLVLIFFLTSAGLELAMGLRHFDQLTHLDSCSIPPFDAFVGVAQFSSLFLWPIWLIQWVLDEQLTRMARRCGEAREQL